ncbi:hypothetical protein TNCV_1645831 [Trichonephila clavipes]|nr:hypothetical protein TNCV_1645831 [Trichonephila clavipes]
MHYREHKIIDVSEKSGSVEDGKRFGRPQTSRTAENIDKVSATVHGELLNPENLRICFEYRKRWIFPTLSV